jgi:signal transduction histidine kinase
VVSDVAACVSARFPAVAVDCQTAPLTAVALFGGERGLAHVLVNVLINACEGNGREGASHITLAAAPDSMHPDFVKVEILDDGPGFPAEILRSGARRGLSTKSDGSGLGLGLVQGLMEASGGDIAIENRPDRGARVVLRFRAGRGVSMPWSTTGVEAELTLP